MLLGYTTYPSAFEPWSICLRLGTSPLAHRPREKNITHSAAARPRGDHEICTPHKIARDDIVLRTTAVRIYSVSYIPVAIDEQRSVGLLSPLAHCAMKTKECICFVGRKEQTHVCDHTDHGLC